MEIQINALKLAEILLANEDRVGSTSWDVYVKKDGTLDVRHNTHDNSEWYEIYDFYSGYDELGDDTEELAGWLESDGIDLHQLVDNDGGYKENKISFEWI